MKKEKVRDDYLKAIGSIVVEFSTLESEIAFAVSLLVGRDLHLGARLTAGENFSSLSRLFETLFKYRVRDKIEIQKLDELLKKLNGINDLRNSTLHSVWSFIRSEEGLIAFAIRRKASKTGSERFSVSRQLPDVAELLQVTENIKQLSNRVTELMSRNEDSIVDHIDNAHNLRSSEDTLRGLSDLRDEYSLIKAKLDKHKRDKFHT